jgi:hypothetical protein
MKKIYIPKKDKSFSAQTILSCAVAFLFGCLATASIILNLQAGNILDDSQHNHLPGPLCPSVTRDLSPLSSNRKVVGDKKNTTTTAIQPTQSDTDPPAPLQVQTMLRNTRILIAIAAFDFSQIPHLEEVIDSYHDVCIAGAQKVDVVVHTTVAYPVTLIDLWNTRFNCETFSLQIVLKPKSLRLHLVDCHRKLFYDRLEDYDLFIYTEDDIRVSPTNVATYLYETARLKHYLDNTPAQTKGKKQHKPSDFNIGIVRYEYNFPVCLGVL